MNNNIYTKDIDFFDLITIFLRYKIIILILTIVIPAIISISYSYSSYQNEIKYPKNKYRAVTRVYSYPSIKTNNVNILFPDQMFYMSYLDSIDNVPSEIKEQFHKVTIPLI